VPRQEEVRPLAPPLPPAPISKGRLAALLFRVRQRMQQADRDRDAALKEGQMLYRLTEHREDCADLREEYRELL
jgi:hypothetical protein